MKMKPNHDLSPTSFSSQYTEKSIVVSGDTKEHKDTLKSIGGKWNKTAGGWLFPSSQKDTVLEKLEDIEDELKNELGDDAEGPPKVGLGCRRRVVGQGPPKVGQRSAESFGARRR